MLGAVQTQVKGVLDNWRLQKTSIFDNRTWSGGASNAAKGRVESHIQKLESLDKQLTSAIDFYNNAYNTVVAAKNEIISISEDAQDQIDDMLNSDTDDEAGRQAQIQGIVNKALMQNSGVVTQHGGRIAVATTPGDPATLPASSGLENSGKPSSRRRRCNADPTVCAPRATDPAAALRLDRRRESKNTVHHRAPPAHRHRQHRVRCNPQPDTKAVSDQPTAATPASSPSRSTSQSRICDPTAPQHKPPHHLPPHRRQAPRHLLQPHPQPQLPAPHPRRACRPAYPVAHLDPAAAQAR